MLSNMPLSTPDYIRNPADKAPSECTGKRTASGHPRDDNLATDKPSKRVKRAYGELRE